MATYRIWCKEPNGEKGSDQGNMISAMDWMEVQGTIIDVESSNTSLQQIGNGDTLRVFAHGSIDKVGGMTAKQLAHYLYDHGLRQVDKVELVACDTAVNTTFKNAFAQRLLEHMVSSKTHNIAITQTKGALGSLAPSRDGNDEVDLGKGKTVSGDAGKKTYSQVQGCFGMKTVST